MKEPIGNENVTDRAMSRSIAASVIGIVVCMACLFGTTWAWYTTSVTSGETVTVGANVDYSIVIDEFMEPDEDGVKAFDGEEHKVTLIKTGTATKSFCQIIATKDGEDAGTTYYYVTTLDDRPYTFAVTGCGTLKFTPMWGTPSDGYTEIPAEGIALGEEQETETAQTEEEAETPTPEPQEQE